jgi:phosphate transport system substrate-binding protein
VKIRKGGADTMVELAQAWAAEYQDANLEIRGGGSGWGIAALIDRKLDIANSSRPVTEKEIEEARKKTGKEPKVHLVGYDALAIYVHRDNPLEEIRLGDLRGIYGKDGGITSWTQLCVEVPGCPGGEIVVVGRQSNCGYWEFFREHVLGKRGEYRRGMKDQRGSKDVVSVVGQIPCAIGYAGMSYRTAAVKFLAVKGKDGHAVGPSSGAVLARTYPLSRPLFMYTLGEGTPEVRKYLDWVRSDAGQKVLDSIGYVTVP